MDILIKRVYDDPAPEDGFRVLVDRLWPRGLSKEHAALDLWDKDVAPSPELRKAYHHDGMSWPDFVAAYDAELAGPAHDAVEALRTQLEAHAVVTLLHSVHDPDKNHAVLLKAALEA